MNPLVSVVIPTRNGRRHIAAAIDSILAQTYAGAEIIIVDDFSDDGTAAMVTERYGSRVLVVVKQPGGGISGVRNAGIAVGSGAYLSFLDHDDLWEPNKLELQMMCLHKQPEIDLVLGHVQNFFDEELTSEERAGILSPMHPLAGLHQGAMLIRRSSFDRVGAFAENLHMGDFLDWYSRAQIAGLRMLMLPETVMRRRLHKTNCSRTHKHLRQQYLATLKQVLDTRRKAAAIHTEAIS